jgi:hypothetical protein
MMKSAEKWRRQNATNGMYCSRRWRVLVDRKVRASLVIQRGLRTPTGPFFARFFIGIIPGLVAEFAFMGQSTSAYQKSNPDIFVMQSAEDWAANNAPCPFYGAR